jgi:hypothetical protein
VSGPTPLTTPTPVDFNVLNLVAQNAIANITDIETLDVFFPKSIIFTLLSVLTFIFCTCMWIGLRHFFDGFFPLPVSNLSQSLEDGDISFSELSEPRLSSNEQQTGQPSMDTP